MEEKNSGVRGSSWEESAQGIGGSVGGGGDVLRSQGGAYFHVICKTDLGSRFLFCSVPHLVLGIWLGRFCWEMGPSLVLSRRLACSEIAWQVDNLVF